MAEITHKRIGELLQGVCNILLKYPDGLRASEVLTRLEKEVPPTTFENSDYPKHPGVRRFEKIVRFSSITMVKAGWLEKAKGYWRLTDTGRDALKNFANPEQFSREASKRDAKSVDLIHDENIEQEDKATFVSFEQASEVAWSGIEEHIQTMDPYDFQNIFVSGLLKGMGYHVAWAAPPGSDGGIDIVAYPDPLGTREPTLKVSVRRRKDAKADVKDLREFLSRLHGSDVGVFISIAGFTREAEKETRMEQRRIRLLDLEALFDLWVEYYGKIPEDERKVLPLRPIWFLATNDIP